MQQLKAAVWRGFVTRLITLGLIVFLPAGTVHYWQAWVFISVYILCNAAITRYLWKNNPELLRQRISGGYSAEKERVQKIIMFILSLSSLAVVIFSALNQRLQLQSLPAVVVVLGDIFIVIGFYITFLVFRANVFASAIIKTINGQKVISTGPYAFVRHPMYAGGLIIFLGIPLALGSYWGLLLATFMIPLFVWRLINEENFLIETLSGYEEYREKIHSRLIPGIF